MRPRRHPLVVIATVVSIGLALSSCAGSPTPTSDANASAPTRTGSPASAPGTTRTAAWTEIDHDLGALGPNVGFLAARVSPDGTCESIHELAPATARPTGSQFKLFVLGALADQVTSGRVSWDRTMTVQDATKSAGNGEGSLQAAAPGTTVTVEEAATKMISISDNTATDMLIGLVGRDLVEAQTRAWSADASANAPFLTTREMLLLHYVPGLGDSYVALPPEQRSAFLGSAVDPRPLTDIGLGLTAEPRYIDKIEWFASPNDICRAFVGLHQLSKDPSLSPLPSVMSREDGTIGLDRAAWPTVWFKGGSEPGVLTLGWLATDSGGRTFVVEAMVSNPDAALSSDSITDLVRIAKKAFGLLD